MLVALRRRYLDLQLAGGDADRAGTLDAYRRACLTVGREVRVLLPGGDVLAGRAADVDTSGRLVFEAPDGTRTALSAGDVEHVR